MNWPDDLYPVRGVMNWVHLLVDETGVVVLDTGFPGDAGRIRRRVQALGAGPGDVRAILLTHGHLDHGGNAAELREWCGAPLYAHPAEQAHLDGTFPYAGAARVCGFLESIGRALTHYRSARIDVPLADGEVLPFWGGMRVVHLPGHTLGHCGFYSLRHDLLFSGDLWVRFLLRTQASPRIFTSAPGLVGPSLRKARAMGARWIVPAHYDEPDAARLRRRFEELCAERDRSRRQNVV